MQVRIEDLSHDGRGVGRIDKKAIFVFGAYPGETVEVNITKEKSKYMEGNAVKIIDLSTERISSICEDFYRCGGCQFCDFKYSAQLKYKQNRVVNDFKKFANIDLQNIKINGMENFYNYRNHIQLKVENGTIGYINKDYTKVFTPKNCIIAPKNTNLIIDVLKNYKMLDKITLVGLRENYFGKKLLVLVTEKAERLNVGDIIEYLKKLGVSHCYQNENAQCKNHYGEKSVKLYGEGDFEEQILENKFFLSPTSFFQVNRSQAEVLYKKAIANLKLNMQDKVLELYSGIGTITVEIAKHSKKVTAIEYAKSSVIDAQKNACLNGRGNIKFISGKVEEQLRTFDTGYKKLLLDPPRAGVHKNALEAISKLRPECISYISCDPATIARDIGSLTRNGNYKLESVEIVDMFPLTSHCEVLALLSN